MKIQPTIAIPSQKAIRRAGGLRRPGREPRSSRRFQGSFSGGTEGSDGPLPLPRP